MPPFAAILSEKKSIEKRHRGHSFDAKTSNETKKKETGNTIATVDAFIFGGGKILVFQPENL